MSKGLSKQIIKRFAGNTALMLAAGASALGQLLTSAPVAGAPAASPSPANAPAANSPAANMTPMQLLQSSRYTQALPHFKRMDKEEPGNISIQYWLGVAASGARDYDLAELAFSKVLVVGQQNSPFVANARAQLDRLPHRYKPISCVQNGKSHKWQNAVPVRIYVSDGRTIAGTLGGTMTQDEYANAVRLIRTNAAGMPRTPTYKSEYSQYIKEGIKAWDWAVSERLFGYTFVNDPARADIVVLFCETCKGGEAGFAVYPWTVNQPEIIWIACAKPATRTSDVNRLSMSQNAAHEFGHCFGLQHSQESADLMYPTVAYRETAPQQYCTPNDKISMRALYGMRTDIVFMPVQ